MGTWPFLAIWKTLGRFASLGLRKPLASFSSAPAIRDDASPLLWAAQWGRDVDVALMLREGHAPNGRGECGRTAAMAASRVDKAGALLMLLRAGADPSLLDENGWSALAWALSHGSSRCVGVLIDHGAPALARSTREALRLAAFDERKKEAFATMERGLARRESLEIALALGEKAQSAMLANPGASPTMRL